MKIKAALPLLTILLLLISSCSRDSIYIQSFDPQDEVSEFNTFSITFSEDVAPVDQLNEWFEAEHLQFEPPLNGVYKWVAPNQLLFSHMEPLQQNVEYTVTFTGEGMPQTAKPFESKTFTFHTAYFDLLRTELFWTHIPQKHYTVSAQVNLFFNYDIDPSQLGEYLDISIFGKPIDDYQIMTDKVSNIIPIDLGEIQQEQESKEIKITVDKGLECLFGDKPMQESRTFELTLPPLERLVIQHVSSGVENNQGWIEVGTSQMVDESELGKYINLDPSPTGSYTFSVNASGFRIISGFEPGNSVKLTIDKGLPGMYGGFLELDYEQELVFADLNPSLDFAETQGRYLMLGGELKIEANAVNIDEIEVTISKIYENNMIHFLERNAYSLFNSGNSYYYNYVNTGNYGQEIGKDSLHLKSIKNQRESFTIDLEPYISNDYKGLYLVSINSSQDRWRKSHKLIAISDLGLIMKRSADEIKVFVNSISTAESLNGVDVELISSTNQVISKGRTDKDGVVTFSGIREDLEEFYPSMIIARNGEDLNYLYMSYTMVEKSRYDVGGRTEYHDIYDAYVYGDRNLYRPGETVNLAVLLRDKMIAVPQEMPVILTIRTPRGTEFKTYKKMTDEQGSFSMSFDLPDYAQTGGWRAVVTTGDERLLATYYFSVEEFVPDKIRVNINKDKEDIIVGETVAFDLESQYLFGAPAANHNYEVDISFYSMSYRSEAFPEFSFSPSSVSFQTMSNYYTTGLLDEEGIAEFEYTAPTDLKTGGIIRANAYATVFEMTGRAVSSMSSFDIYTKDYFQGIRMQGYYHATGKNIATQLIAVDEEDKVINGFDGEVELVRYKWHTVLKRNNYGNYYYASEQQEEVQWRKSIQTGSTPKDYDFTVNTSGRYELRFYKKGSEDYVYKSFYVYGYGATTGTSFEVDREGRIEMVFDKESYQPGDKAKILITAPFSGKLLLTVERESVIEYRYIDLEDNATEVTLNVDDAWLPNVYVSATLFRPHQGKEQGVPFMVAHGYGVVKVEEPDRKLPVEIIAPERIKPNTTQNITIKTEADKDIRVTLAVVDEGILQLKNYKSPNPYDFFYAKRMLQVTGYDLYEYLIPELLGKDPSTGGGDGMNSSARLNPVQAQRFKPFGFWSGILKTNSKGEVTVPVDFPQLNTEVRIMAVVFDEERMGAGSKPMKVSNDIILLPSVPRFITLGDSLIIPVGVMNTTDKEAKVQVSMNIDGPLTENSGTKQSITLEAGRTGTVHFSLLADQDLGVSTISFSGSGPEDVSEEIEIGIRPPSPLVKDYEAGTIKSGETVEIDISEEYLAATLDGAISISKFPAVQFADHLRYLVGYPYGCLEQTVSKAFPQLYFEDLSALVAPDLMTNGSPVYFVNEAILKISAMQDYSGLFRYWPSYYRVNQWASVFATHFLLEARKAGYSVPDQMLNQSLDAIEELVRSRSTFDYVTYQNNSRVYVKKANKEILYGLYVLALAGKADQSSMNYYLGHPNLLSNDSRYLLAGAYALTNNWNVYHQLVNNSFVPEITERLNSGSFDSEIRANAIMLNVLLEVDPTNKQIPQIINYLSRNADMIYNTQERCFTFLGLGKAASLQKDNNVSVEILLNSKNIGTFNGEDLRLEPDLTAGGKITLSASGNGSAYYFIDFEGVPADGNVEETDEQLVVRRNFYDRFGKPVRDLTFHQNELVVVEITLSAPTRSVENVVIADLLAAGFEIENPRLTTSTNLSWIPTEYLLRPEYVDIRDDRLLLFGTASTGQKLSYYYMMRAVNQGTFVLPVIGVDAMYNPDYHSYNGRRTVTILPPVQSNF